MGVGTLHVISYIDMLGTTAKIEASDNIQAFLHMKTIYEQMIGVFTEGSMKTENIKIKVFSDNIIIAKETNSSDDAIMLNLNQMIALAASFQFRAMLSGWPVRGGITIGNLYIDDTFVWGEGLLRAYKLESKIAINPRIVIDPSIEEKYINGIKLWRKDAGLPIVNYLALCANEETMKGVKNPIIEMLNSASEETIGKIDWLKNDFNRICTERNYTDLIIC